MARQARQTQNSSVFSIKQKTNQVLFRDKEDRKEFVSIMKSSKAMYGFDIYAYCLLDEDEFWLILNAKNRSIASIMQSITISYALYRSDVDQLFSNRYNSKPIYNIEELNHEIEMLKSDSRYQSCSYCFYNPTKNIPLPFISLLDEPIEIAQKHQKRLSDDAFVKVVSQSLKTKDVEKVSDRNLFIKEIYANYNVTQRQLADYFELSISAISKILRQSA